MKKFLITIISLCLLLMCITINVSASSATPTQNKHYYIRNVKTGKYLTVVDYVSNEKANLVQQTLNYYSWQCFQLSNKTTINGLVYFEIISDDLYTQLRVDVENVNNSDGANIQVYKRNPSYISAQRFSFISNGDGTYRIKPQLSSDKVLDVVNGYSAENTNIQLYTYTGATQQKWELVEASYFLCRMNLVDSGKHLDWKNNSNLNNSIIESSTDVWNSYKSGVIRKDNAIRINDLTIEDDASLTSLASTSPSGVISLSSSLYDLSEDTIISVMAHEFGHALNLGHINDSSQQMYHSAKSTYGLGSFDKSSYDKAYSLY